jgi:hypothetical protein
MTKVKRKCGHEEEFIIPPFAPDPSVSDDENEGMMNQWDEIQTADAEKLECSACTKVKAETLADVPAGFDWKCGHPVTQKDLTTSKVLQKSDREKREKVDLTLAMQEVKASKNLCGSCWLENEKKLDAEAEQGMPELKGSPAQVKYAIDVRTKKIRNLWKLRQKADAEREAALAQCAEEVLDEKIALIEQYDALKTVYALFVEARDILDIKENTVEMDMKNLLKKKRNKVAA